MAFDVYLIYLRVGHDSVSIENNHFDQSVRVYGHYYL